MHKINIQNGRQYPLTYISRRLDHDLIKKRKKGKFKMAAMLTLYVAINQTSQ